MNLFTRIVCIALLLGSLALVAFNAPVASEAAGTSIQSVSVVTD